MGMTSPCRVSSLNPHPSPAHPSEQDPCLPAPSKARWATTEHPGSVPQVRASLGPLGMGISRTEPPGAPQEAEQLNSCSQSRTVGKPPHPPSCLRGGGPGRSLHLPVSHLSGLPLRPSTAGASSPSTR